MTPRYSAGIVPIRYAHSGLPELLMLRVYKLWDFPKGMLEGDEDHLTAAIRELQEETTLSECHFKWGHDFVETGPYSQGKYSRYFLGECLSGNVSLPINPELGRPEHHDFRWMSVPEARALVRPRLLPVFDWIEQVLNIS